MVELRVSQADELLSHVEGTGSEKADEHVKQARALTDDILSELE
ncbi:hypothetical protein [Haladaptatus caseinilyticus]|nr:hypothetical protein [Haladaptatus caseinilyticus]